MLRFERRPRLTDDRRARLLREQLEYSVLAMSRGAYGVLALAIAVSAAFCSADLMGNVPVWQAAVFCALVCAWSTVALGLIRVYRSMHIADDRLPVWDRRFCLLFFANGLCWSSPVFLLWADGAPVNNFCLLVLCVLCVANAANEHGDAFQYFISLTVGCVSLTLVGALLQPSAVFTAAVVLVPAGTAWFTFMALHARRRFTELVMTRIDNEELAASCGAARDEALALKGKAESASSAKSAFLANMSHELRTPLNAIIGFAQIVRDEMFGPIGSPRYKEYVADIESSGQHLLGIINDLLDVAKVEAGRIELDRHWTEPCGFIDEAIRVARGQPGASSARITANYQHGASRVFADPRMMRQAVLNLVSNAIKHNLPGAPVDITTSIAGDGALRIAVNDRGEGIPPHMLEKVFEVFEQADNSYARDKQGTGLGLALVRAFVTAHSGRVWLESAEGAGTTAIIELPRPAPASVSLAA
jgi:two-component system cell cycle sensor histidine kinase PleC